MERQKSLATLAARGYFCGMLLRFGFILIVVMLASSCANIKGISGGPEDKTPPGLDAAKSTPNYSRNFNGREIQLSFDEWVKLDNPLGNITISPSLQFTPEYKLKGKSLILQWDRREVLQAQTTYTIQFGDCIKDITSGNVLRSLKFVFSTGAILDSLSLSGVVRDAFQQTPKSKILVSLYRNPDDTAFQRTKPFYFGWTDDKGMFRLDNLGAGDYKLYALEDRNQNYYFDQTTEAIAFLDGPVQIGAIAPQLDPMNLSTGWLPTAIKDRKIQRGTARFQFSKKPKEQSLACPVRDSVFSAHHPDSCIVWNFSNSTQTCSLKFDGIEETFTLDPWIDAGAAVSGRFQVVERLVRPGESLWIKWEEPVYSFQPGGFGFADSTVRIIEIVKDPKDPRRLGIRFEAATFRDHSLWIQAGSVQGFRGRTNPADTVKCNLLSPAALSRLKIKLDSLTPGSAYVFQILIQDAVKEEVVFDATESSRDLFFPVLFPGKYRARLIHDRNRNQIWDPADFNTKSQPENIWYYDLTDLRADWDVQLHLKP
ncbi:MAG TPA: Ig-like domain-containing protein [Saprospiraceae bacterium]|nr:Ig-like domain-containing protein [Saprospiraceae bacterium]